MQDVLQAIGTVLLTHTLWLPTKAFSTDTGMRTLSPKHPELSMWISLGGLLIYLASYVTR